MNAGLMVENVTQIKSGIMVSVGVSVKKVILGILLRVVLKMENSKNAL